MFSSLSSFIPLSSPYFLSSNPFSLPRSPSHLLLWHLSFRLSNQYLNSPLLQGLIIFPGNQTLLKEVYRPCSLCVCRCVCVCMRSATVNFFWLVFSVWKHNTSVIRVRIHIGVSLSFFLIPQIFNKIVNSGGKSIGSRFRRLRKFCLVGGSKKWLWWGGTGTGRARHNPERVKIWIECGVDDLVEWGFVSPARFG